MRQLISLHCRNLENPFQGGPGIQNPARVSKSQQELQDKLHAVALVQCGCDIIPAGTQKRDRHYFGDVVVRGFAPVTVDFVYPDRLSDCHGWAF